jgi:hypothetical protein
MSNDARITLIFDRFAISSENGQHISGLNEEREAFTQINDSLRRDSRLETVVPRVYIISRDSTEHFRTYREVRGVRIFTVTPRGVVGNLLQCEPPPWLTDDDIVEQDLLKYAVPDSMVGDSWEATIATWLIPGIDEAANLEQWLRIVASAKERFGSSYGAGPVSVWLQNQFHNLATATEVDDREWADSLQAELTRARSPVEFAKLWVRRRAVLPLMGLAIDNPLRLPTVGSHAMNVRERQLAARLPLTYPLPAPLHDEVSKLFCRALHKVRLNEPHRIADAIRCLNAVWPGVAEEIQTWLEIYPKGMSNVAANHLQGLPGYDSNDLMRRLVDHFRPPNPVSQWPGIAEAIEPWLQSYSTYIRSCFLRRDLNESDDPAIGFGRWLKDHPTVCFEHHKYSYFKVAQAVQQGLSAERTVFLVMVDALPIHQSVDAVGFLSDNLGEFPTFSSFVFVPIPTVTEVCKEAILTGKLPSECRGDIKNQLQKRFSLSDDEILLAANWKDAERLQINAETRLVVYRDNRLDDQLHRLGSYAAMLEDSKAVFLQLSRLLRRWSDDIRCITQKPPLILLTADHGYTFGPTPGSETVGRHTLDGAYRCSAVNGPVSAADSIDDSITVIDKDTFRLKQNYLAARGRYFGRGTMSGWAMAHGGLLPEEVIVPFIEWFGNEELTPWPSINLGECGYVEQGTFVLVANIVNPRNLPTIPCTLKFSIPGEDGHYMESVSSLAVNASITIEVRLAIRYSDANDSMPISVVMRSKERKTGDLLEKSVDLLVQRKKRLVEKTREQDEFENMFGSL